MTINERVKYLRKEILHKTQEDFAPQIHISRSNLGAIEIGRINVTDRVISDISTTFMVNDQWLRTGEGEIFFKPQKNDLVAKAAVLLGQKDPVFEAFVETYSKLDPSNREVLLKWGIDFLKSLQQHSEDS